MQTDVLGRAFDFGMVMKSTRVGSVDVLVLDRWTVKGLDDTTLAESGVAPGTTAGLLRTLGIQVPDDDGKLLHDLGELRLIAVSYTHLTLPTSDLV